MLASHQQRCECRLLCWYWKYNLRIEDEEQRGSPSTSLLSVTASLGYCWQLRISVGKFGNHPLPSRGDKPPSQGIPPCDRVSDLNGVYDNQESSLPAIPLNSQLHTTLKGYCYCSNPERCRRKPAPTNTSCTATIARLARPAFALLPISKASTWNMLLFIWSRRSKIQVTTKL